jgi:pimeloyl-ACP methyl ester carboxylesterase
MERLTRRRVLVVGIGTAAGAAAGGVELVARGVLPGRHLLAALTGGCSAASPSETFVDAGVSVSGRFYSPARGRRVGYTLAYPPGHSLGSRLPLAVVLHGFGGDHSSPLGGVGLARALAARPAGRTPLPPIALVAVDGGGLYWHRHPGDDPMAMIVRELIPFCRRLGLGRRPHRIGAIGTSMGGYGALLLAEQHPRLISAVGAISPAIWTTYAQARAANPGAFTSARDFASDDVIAHASALHGTPVRVASGRDDPFHPGVLALAHALPRSATVEIAPGCHDGSFFDSQRPATLAFVAGHLASA